MFVRSFTAIVLAAGVALASSPALAQVPDTLPDARYRTSFMQPSLRQAAPLPKDCQGHGFFLNAKNELSTVLATTADVDGTPGPVFVSEKVGTPMPGGIATLGYLSFNESGSGATRVSNRLFYVVDTTGALRILTTQHKGENGEIPPVLLSNVLVKKDFGKARSLAMYGNFLYVLHADNTFRRYPVTPTNPTVLGAGVVLGKGAWNYTTMTVVRILTVGGKTVHRFRGLTTDAKLNDVRIDAATGAATVTTVGSGWKGNMGLFSGFCSKSEQLAVLTVAVKPNDSADLWYDVNNKAITKRGAWLDLKIGQGRIFG